MIQARNVEFPEYVGYNRTLFLPRATAITNYSYTVPSDYHLAYFDVYIDAASGVSHSVSVNGATLGYNTANTRMSCGTMVTAGDVITITRQAGSTDPYHTGYIRKIF